MISDNLQEKEALLSNAAYVLVDANISVESVNWLIQFTNLNKIRMIIEPVSSSGASHHRDCDARKRTDQEVLRQITVVLEVARPDQTLTRGSCTSC